MDIFEEIGIALMNESRRQGISRFPAGTLAVHVASWATKAADMTFDLWPCPANPTASWGDGEPADEGLSSPPKLKYIELCASRVAPVKWTGETYPVAYIDSNFVEVLPDHGSLGRFWAQDSLSLRAPNLYLPAPGVAATWPRLKGIPNVTVWLMYDDGVGVLLASRFDEGASTNGRSHNTHLFDLPTPPEWLERKQFGDERRPKKQRSRPRKQYREPPALSD